MEVVGGNRCVPKQAVRSSLAEILEFYSPSSPVNHNNSSTAGPVTSTPVGGRANSKQKCLSLKKKRKESKFDTTSEIPALEPLGLGDTSGTPPSGGH